LFGGGVAIDSDNLTTNTIPIVINYEPLITNY